MKNIVISILLTVVILFSSCNKWLDVKPKNQIDTKEMFRSQNGFKDALTGCYIKLKSRDIYGEQLTMSTVEHLILHWSVDPKTAEEALNNRNYENGDARAQLDRIYKGLYNTIASANDILAHIDLNKDVFENENMRLMIKAEAMAIRAFCHFDVLRLYGPVPKDLSVETKDELTYVTEFTFEHIDRTTYQQFIANIEKDLNAASDLLKETDPFLTHNISSINRPESSGLDPFMGYRKFRFNYYAVEGIKARFYLYTQQKEKAYTTAMNLINAKDVDGSNKFTLSTSSDLAKGNLVLSTEHLLSLNIYNLGDYAHPLFKTDKKLIKPQKTVLKDVYANSIVDDRYTKGWVEIVDFYGKKTFTPNKYFQPATTSNGSMYFDDCQMVSLIRMSEIYLIAMECGTLSQCNELAKKYYPARYLEAVDFTSDAQRDTEIVNQYRRDFYAEGQMFFTYKRFALKRIIWVSRDLNLKEYIIPMPDTDINYGL